MSLKLFQLRQGCTVLFKTPPEMQKGINIGPRKVGSSSYDIAAVSRIPNRMEIWWHDLSIIAGMKTIDFTLLQHQEWI